MLWVVLSDFAEKRKDGIAITKTLGRMKRRIVFNSLSHTHMHTFQAIVTTKEVTFLTCVYFKTK